MHWSIRALLVLPLGALAACLGSIEEGTGPASNGGASSGGGAAMDASADRSSSSSSSSSSSGSAGSSDGGDAGTDGGIATPDAGSFTCGDTTCDAASEYCEYSPGGCGILPPDGGCGNPPSFTCKPIPKACNVNRTCACLASQSGTFGTCNEDGGRLRVDLPPPP